MLSKLNNDLTGTRRRSEQQWLFGDCTFKFDDESIPVCGGGAPIHEKKVAVDRSEVAVHQGDSSVPTIKPENSWHRVSVASCQL